MDRRSVIFFQMMTDSTLAGLGGNSPHSSDGVTGSEGVSNEFEEVTRWTAGDDIKGNQCVLKADEILRVGIEDAEIIIGPIVATGGYFFEALSDKPSVDLLLSDGHDVKAWLRSDDHEVVSLIDDTLQAVQVGNKFVLQQQALQILDGGGVPKVEFAGILRRGNERQLNAWGKAEDAIACGFENTVSLTEPVVFLTTTLKPGDNFFFVQQQSQTSRPFTKVFFLPGERGRPKCADTCWRNSSEVIERREDKILSICSWVSSGFTGGWLVGIWDIGGHVRLT